MPSHFLMDEEQEVMTTSSQQATPSMANTSTPSQKDIVTALPEQTPLTSTTSPYSTLESKQRLSQEEDDEEEEEGDDYSPSEDSITRLIDGKSVSVTVVNPSSDESLVTKSAFEITSVSRVPPEETDDSINIHTSKDQDELQKSLLEARNRDSNRLSTSSAESELDYSSSATTSNTAGSNGDIPPLINDGGGTNPPLKPPDVAVITAMSSMATNGPAQPQSRFRRVNKYVRGRWAVRDSLEPEGDPRPESEMKMAPNTSAVKLYHETSPSVVRKQQSYIDRNHDNELNGTDEFGNYMRSHSMVPSVPRDSGPPSESIHSLSRTNSISSIIREHQEDLESMVSMPLSVVTPDIQQPNSNLLDRPIQRCECEDCTSSISHEKSLQDCQQGLENAMSHLQSQFLLFFQGSQYRLLQEERNKLAKENERLHEQITLLRQEIETLKSSAMFSPQANSSDNPLSSSSHPPPT